MKKVFSVLIIGVLLLGIIGCNSKNVDNKKTKVRIGEESGVKIENNDVIFKLKENTLTKSNGTFILENNSDLTVGYGEGYWVEKEQNGKWYSLETISDRIFNLPLYYLEPNNIKELKINLEYGYGKLTPGKYRVVKDMTIIYENDNFKDFNAAAEFTIN
ncbi:MAG: hypothetical protein NC483_04390 [Ruminococcus sp.]|nr:hypothetical protein [Ruminococcus sp.]